jgi:hypothetical protein
MDSLEIYEAIKNYIDKKYGKELITPIMYADIHEKIPKQCYDILENVSTQKYKGLYKRFEITVKDNGEHK